MIFKETENKEFPTIILLHGGGLSWWSLKPIIELLKNNFHVVTPIIDGHGEAAKETFVSIENSALKLIEYIDDQYNGKVFAIGGLSIGAQIVTEVLSLRNNITENAIIESALVYPMKGAASMTIPTYKLFYGLIKKRWFSKLQSKTLCVPDKMFEQYYDDSLKITKESLINITLSNGNYHLKNSISDTKSRVLVIVGEKELRIMKKSGIRLHEAIADSELYIAPNMRHGGISLLYPEQYVTLIANFFNKKK
ncbi:pimeloyl-ACP methyl ester carboxylesterase [Mobilisporobacter senegalensis]|uniref:Pimeloyl-ACP methyl ester carboxylesterase n=1 Tax=Mobilisporobacter senegalensis TaxID=1329262 RepID=A0A3N1XNK2_9FIRM|nr:alpha/beta hydrolase [Mobilisporobacter senegalensis]ROR28226.1 pimeloyl-ACP methyl ester carboxylesterase [Mobilisporobacter senegalensis]